MLTFCYGVMSSGKSLQLMKTRYNYISTNKNVITVIPDYDSGRKTISSRAMKEEIEVDVVLKHDEFLKDCIENIDTIDAIFVDEAQFLTIPQVHELRKISVENNIEIYCFGLLTTTENEMFDASKELLLLSHKAKQLHSLCQCCGEKYASHHIKHEGGQHDKDSYESVCFECWEKNK